MDALRDMMTGLSLSQLVALKSRLAGPTDEGTDNILHGVSVYFAKLARQHTLAPPASLMADIDHGIEGVSAAASPTTRREGTIALLSLRRNLFPAAHVLAP
jgi:hypothetical protein